MNVYRFVFNMLKPKKKKKKFFGFFLYGAADKNQKDFVLNPYLKLSLLFFCLKKYIYIMEINREVVWIAVVCSNPAIPKCNSKDTELTQRPCFRCH